MMRIFLDIWHNDIFKSTALIVLGFILAQAEHLFASRRERRKAISRALAELLDVRYQFVATETLCRAMETLGPIPAQAKSQLRLVIDSFLPDWKELHSRYDESVTTLAGLDPLLAFRIRSKDLVRPYIQRVHAIMSQDAQAATALAPIFAQTTLDRVEPELKAAILKLALKRGLITWYKVRWALKRGASMADELNGFMKSFKAIIDTQAKAAGVASAAQPTSPTT